MKGLPRLHAGLLQPLRALTVGCMRPVRYFSSATIRPGILGLDRGDLRKEQEAKRRRLDRHKRASIRLQKRGLRKPPPRVYPPPPSVRKNCKDPIAALTNTQFSILDATGARARLFDPGNPDAAKVGDILLVRQRGGDTFAGVCLNIRKQGVDTAILLRNQLTRVGVEMWYKIYSPNVEGIEVVQRRVRRARRARLYYMRKPKHDPGSVENIVAQYKRQRQALRSGDSKGRDVNANKKKHKKSK